MSLAAVLEVSSRQHIVNVPRSHGMVAHRHVKTLVAGHAATNGHRRVDSIDRDVTAPSLIGAAVSVLVTFAVK